MSDHSKFYACIMAGGSGERFWPMSRAQTPKHLLKLLSERTLVEETVRRLGTAVPRENIFVLTNEVQLPGTRAALAGLVLESQIIAEPAKRDTAPAAALATALVRARNPNGILALLPADALIHDSDKFGRQLRDAFEYAETKNVFFTFGIKPWFPATGFGYLELGNGSLSWKQTKIRPVARFVEKPNLPDAQRFFAGGQHYWNAGIFLWRADAFLAEATNHAPELAEFVRDFPAGDASEYISKRFPVLPKNSIDYAIMEKAQVVETLISEFDWDDVGSWEALPKHIAPDNSGNTIRGAVVVAGASNNIAISNGRTIALCGVKDLVVVETADAILVCHRDSVQDIKKVVQQLPKELL
jgi:mannose-1-phosphate guanylyltransferase